MQNEKTPIEIHYEHNPMFSAVMADSVLPQYLFDNACSVMRSSRAYSSFRAENIHFLRKKFKFNYPHKVVIHFVLRDTNEGSVPRAINGEKYQLLLCKTENPLTDNAKYIYLKNLPLAAIEKMAERKWTYLYRKKYIARRSHHNMPSLHELPLGNPPTSAYPDTIGAQIANIPNFLSQNLATISVLRRVIWFDEHFFSPRSFRSLVGYIGDKITLQQKIKERLFNGKFVPLGVVAKGLGVDEWEILQFAAREKDFDVVVKLPQGMCVKAFDSYSERVRLDVTAAPNLIAVGHQLCQVIADKGVAFMRISKKGYDVTYGLKNPNLYQALPDVIEISVCAIPATSEYQSVSWYFYAEGKDVAIELEVKPTEIYVPKWQQDIIKSHVKNFVRTKPWLIRDADKVINEWRWAVKFHAQQELKASLGSKTKVKLSELIRSAEKFLKDNKLYLDRKRMVVPSDAAIKDCLVRDNDSPWKNRKVALAKTEQS